VPSLPALGPFDSLAGRPHGTSSHSSITRSTIGRRPKFTSDGYCGHSSAALRRNSPSLLITSNSEFDEWPLSRPAGVRSPPAPAPIVRPGAPTPPVTPVQPRLDRLQLASWAILRSQQSGIAGSQSLASGGHLGASQAGVRVIYNLNRQLAFTAGRVPKSGAGEARLPSGARQSAVKAEAEMPSLCSLRAGSTSARCPSGSRLTPTFRAAWSGRTAATRSWMAALPRRGPFIASFLRGSAFGWSAAETLSRRCRAPAFDPGQEQSQGPRRLASAARRQCSARLRSRSHPRRRFLAPLNLAQSAICG